MGEVGGLKLLDALECKFVVAKPEDLPPEHRFLLVAIAGAPAYGFALPDPQSQAEVRIAALEWERTQRMPSPAS